MDFIRNQIDSLPVSSLNWKNIRALSIYGNGMDSTMMYLLDSTFGEKTVIKTDYLPE